MKKRFEVTLDVKQSVFNRGFEVVEGDTGNELLINLTDGGTPVDLTGCTVLMAFSNSKGTASQSSIGNQGGVSIGGVNHNEIAVALFNSSFAPGMVECEVQVFSGVNYETQVTSAKFNFSCRRSIFNADTLPAQKEYSVLTGLIRQVGDEISAMQTAVNQIEERTHHASRHAEGGVDPVTPESIGTTPQRIGAATMMEYAATLTTTWTGTAAPYTQMVNIAGITASDTPIADVALSDVLASATAQLEAWACVSKIETGNGSITVTCYTSMPTVAIPIILKVVR